MIKITTDEALTLDKIVALVILEELSNDIVEIEFVSSGANDGLYTHDSSLSEAALRRFEDNPKSRAFASIVAVVSDKTGQHLAGNISKPYTIRSKFSETEKRISDSTELYNYMRDMIMFLFAYQYDFNVRLKEKKQLVNEVIGRAINEL